MQPVKMPSPSPLDHRWNLFSDAWALAGSFAVSTLANLVMMSCGISVRLAHAVALAMGLVLGAAAITVAAATLAVGVVLVGLPLLAAYLLHKTAKDAESWI